MSLFEVKNITVAFGGVKPLMMYHSVSIKEKYLQ